MAKDEKGTGSSGKDDDYEFVPADFDEDAFIHREMVSFRTTTILFVWGIVAAALSYAVFHLVDGAKVGWLAGLAIAAATGFALKWLFPALKADTKHFGRREWAGTGFLFFFTWLAFFLIAINPPLSDFAPPRVDLHAAPAVQQAGDDVAVYAFFEDNHRVASHDFTVIGPNGPVAAIEEDLGRGQARILATGLPPGVYTVAASAEDGKGLRDNATIQFAVVEDAIKVTTPDGLTLDDPGDRVLVTVGGGLKPCAKRLLEQCVRTVYLDLGGGSRVVLEHNAAAGAWLAYPNHAGWRQGQVNFTAVAEMINAYAGSTPIEGGRLTSEPAAVTVTATPGDYEPKVIQPLGAPRRSVPGLGLPLLAVSLVALVAFARRKA